jgi:hypothetical protein
MRIQTCAIRAVLSGIAVHPSSKVLNGRWKAYASDQDGGPEWTEDFWGVFSVEPLAKHSMLDGRPLEATPRGARGRLEDRGGGEGGVMEKGLAMPVGREHSFQITWWLDIMRCQHELLHGIALTRASLEHSLMIRCRAIRSLILGFS